MSIKQNCWEFMRCGREPHGDKTVDLGLCPAATDQSFDGINGGKCAGRICWAVAGTLCGGKVQGTFAEKRGGCIGCTFFKKVQREQGSDVSTAKFLRYLSEEKRAMLGSLSYRFVRAGERFITQGEIRNCAYVIARGSGLVIVEKDGELLPVGHRGPGDIVGVVQILTGEPQHVHVEAETDMELWVLGKEQFDDISRKAPDFLDFITEIAADRFDSKRPMADRIIGKYIATDIIGRGGYSIVYKGTHQALKLPVAIKMMRHNLIKDPAFLDTFRNEAKIIANLNHRNIVKVYDIEERFKTIFIIMELVEGESLKDMLDRLKTIPPLVAVHLLAQTCSGLHFAHRSGILHQDINPTNIFVQRDDEVKILDFGLACPLGAEDRSIFDGTVHYMAPEQIRCEPVDQRTDVYSLGVTAFEMLTGRKPYEAVHLKTLMSMHCDLDIPDPAALVPEVPEKLRRFILKACARDPARRYQNAEEAFGDLEPMDQRVLRVSRDTGPHGLQRTTNLSLRYPPDKQPQMNLLIEEFCSRAQALGAEPIVEES
jgi:CRP-like cAMP-binding protein